MKHIYLFLFVALIYSSCTLEVSKVDDLLDPSSSGNLTECLNGALNFPACNECPSGQNLNPNNICMEETILDCITGIGRTLAWDSYTDQNATGFRLYRSSNNVNFSVLVNSITPYTTNQYALIDNNGDLRVQLNPCVENYLYLTAYGQNLESSPSNVVCWGRCD